MTLSIAANQTIAASPILPEWRKASWEEYVQHRDRSQTKWTRVFFNDGYLWVDEMGEGINHARINNLFTLILGLWLMNQMDQNAEILGGCQMDQPQSKAAAPDLVVYLGEGAPQWQEGESRYIDLTRWRSPDLVGEIADTTLASDLDEKKQIYAALAIPEYWVIDVVGRRVLAFRLREDGKYQQCTESGALPGLPIDLLSQTLELLDTETNIRAANWFAQQIANLPAA